MGADEIDPVQFGRLIELGEQNREAMQEIKQGLRDLTDATSSKLNTHETRLNEIDLRDEKRKHMLLGALGAGTLGGATFGEAIKNFFKHIIG